VERENTVYKINTYPDYREIPIDTPVHADSSTVDALPLPKHHIWE